MKTLSIISSACLSLAILLAPTAAEASGSTRLYIPRDQRVDRPTTRSINATARNYWEQNATVRRSFMRKLQRIEQAKDEIAPEDAARPAPRYRSNAQDFTPYHWIRRRRSVRHQYWDSYYQRGTPAHTGQGLLGQPGLVEEEEHRNDIEVDAGGR